MALEIAEWDVIDFQPDFFSLEFDPDLTSVLQSLLDNCGEECSATDFESTALCYL